MISLRTLGAAPKWRLGEGLSVLQKSLEKMGNRLIFRRGSAAKVLEVLVTETGAASVFWQRAYDPDSQARDMLVKRNLSEKGVKVQSFKGHLLFEPWTVQTKVGGFYKVYTPMWNSVRDRDVPLPLPTPARIPAPSFYPNSDCLADWNLGIGMRRGAKIVSQYARVGSHIAQKRLEEFTQGGLGSLQRQSRYTWGRWNV